MGGVGPGPALALGPRCPVCETARPPVAEPAMLLLLWAPPAPAAFASPRPRTSRGWSPWWLPALVLALAIQGAQAARGSVHCAERRDITPCTCNPMTRSRSIEVMCERMTSFGQVVTALHGRFQPGVHIALSVSFSQLDDIPERGFDELGLSVTKLTLKGNKLSQLPEEAFAGLNGTSYLNLADNALPEIPTPVLALMPKVRTLDLSCSRVTTVRTQDLQVLPELQHLVLVGNALTTLEKGSIPKTLKHLHLGRNELKHLNGTLRELLDLEWLFLNFNQLSTLDGELPERGMEKLHLVFVANNRLERLPDELRFCPRLETMLASNNSIVSLNGVFSRARRLQLLELGYNKIRTLAEDDFLEAENIEELHLGNNEIESLNSSLLRIRELNLLNLTHNRLTEFSLQEIHGLQRLKIVDLTYNRIARLSGRMENVVDSETRVEELRLEYNALVSLDGALGGIQGLERLNLSHNMLASISPDDLIGLDQLKALDVSFNQLHTLEETSKTFMPALEELMASHNLLTSLERDFHGLPALCRADLSSNNISRIHQELTAKTRCKVHGVNSVLRIVLYDNPVRCDEQLARALLVFQTNLTELQGVPTCTLTLPQMLLLSVGVQGVQGVQVPMGSLSMPVHVPVQMPVLPAMYSGVSGVMGVPGAPAPALMLNGYPIAPLQPLAPPVAPTTTTTTTSTTTTTTTTTTTPPPPPETTTSEATELTTGPTTTVTPQVTEEVTTALPPSTTTTTPEVSEPGAGLPSGPEESPDSESESVPVAAPELEAVPEAVPAPLVPLPAITLPEEDDRLVVPVLKELPPVIQLLQPEVSVQPSKDLPRLVDDELLVLAAAPLPPPPPPTAPPSSTSTPPTAPPAPPPSQQPPEEPPESPKVDESGDEPPDEPAGKAPPPASTTPSTAAAAEPPPQPPPAPQPALEPMAADSPPEMSELQPLILIKLLNETALPVPLPDALPLEPTAPGAA
ncbi:hypothetical protein FOCC_FOCC017849 [Frankliniella occidentalis]|nr:hypothetical protein FOCC_FOCC017849 [Frankliniella occidentalis]